MRQASEGVGVICGLDWTGLDWTGGGGSLGDGYKVAAAGRESVVVCVAARVPSTTPGHTHIHIYIYIYTHSPRPHRANTKGRPHAVRGPRRVVHS